MRANNNSRAETRCVSLCFPALRGENTAGHRETRAILSSRPGILQERRRGVKLGWLFYALRTSHFNARSRTIRADRTDRQRRWRLDNSILAFHYRSSPYDLSISVVGRVITTGPICIRTSALRPRRSRKRETEREREREQSEHAAPRTEETESVGQKPKTGRGSIVGISTGSRLANFRYGPLLRDRSLPVGRIPGAV